MYGPVAGSGLVPMSLFGVPFGTHVGERDGQLLQEVGVGLAQVEGDRAGGVVGHDALGEVAGLGRLRARVAADDALRRSPRPARRP